MFGITADRRKNIKILFDLLSFTPEYLLSIVIKRCVLMRIRSFSSALNEEFGVNFFRADRESICSVKIIVV